MSWFKKKIVAEDPQGCTDSAKVVEIDIASSWSVQWEHIDDSRSSRLVYTSVTKRFFKDKESAELFRNELIRADKILCNKGAFNCSLKEEKA